MLDLDIIVSFSDYCIQFRTHTTQQPLAQHPQNYHKKYIIMLYVFCSIDAIIYVWLSDVLSAKLNKEDWPAMF
ncbi:hypothetical protein GCM10022278_11260 [Allohahella marinimesophila]|uniref:Uncharacterized protein n=1 Tax=Allohahella marinimesophila TaxID=1054972 RepID=A0ABP7NUB7_9GAMM